MAGADISVIYEVRRQQRRARAYGPRCVRVGTDPGGVVSCSTNVEERTTHKVTVDWCGAGRVRVIEVSQPAAPTTCEPTEPGLMNGVLPFLSCL